MLKLNSLSRSLALHANLLKVCRVGSRQDRRKFFAPLKAVAIAMGISLTSSSVSLAQSPEESRASNSTTTASKSATESARRLTLEEAIQSAPSVLAAERELKARKAAQRSALSTYGPRLDAFAGAQDQREGHELNRGSIAGLELKWNLWRGGGDHARVKRADAEVEAAEATFRREQQLMRSELLAQIGRALMAHELVEIEERELKLNQEHSEMAQRKVAAGLTSRIDKLEFELRRNEIEARLEDYRVQLQDQLSRLESFGLADPKTSSDLSQGWREHLKLSPKLETSLEVSATEPLVRSQTLQASSARATHWGELDLLASAGRLRAGDRRGDFEDRHYELKFRIPLWASGQIQSQVREAQALASREESRLAELRRQKQVERLDLQRQVASSRKLLELAKSRVQRAQNYFDMTTAEYRRGIKNSPDLASASELLFEAQKHRAEIEVRLGEILARSLAY